jgi:hypothetical protein
VRDDLPHLFLDLPIDIWDVVLGHCAPDPLAQDPDNLLAPGPSLASHFAAVYTIRQLSLVCRVWNQMVQKCLYGNIWITSARAAHGLAGVLRQSILPCNPDHIRQRGAYIRDIRVAASAFLRCNPADVLTIVDHAPDLRSFNDTLGLRRPRAGFGPVPARVDPGASPEAYTEHLADRTHLTTLAWTTYDDRPIEPALGPILRGRVGTQLTRLELSFLLSSDMPDAQPLVFAPEPGTGALVLPALRSLRVDVDTGALFTLAAWELPVLHALAVVARDYGCVAAGLAAFLGVHGERVKHLELAHATDEIALLSTKPGPEEDLDLAAAVPHLQTLVCDADAEWCWQDPDWIAPHVLLPSHDTLVRIAVRGIAPRVGDWSLSQQLDSLCLRAHFPMLQAVRDLSSAGRAFARAPADSREDIRKFWMKTLRNYRQAGVAFEDCDGVVIPVPDLSTLPGPYDPELHRSDSY